MTVSKAGQIRLSNTAVARLPLLNDQERRKILCEWNNTDMEFPKDKCAHQLFEDQVKNHPAASAVVFDSGSLSYEDLNRRANQLAHYLRKMGVRPDSRVAICADRSPEMVVALLAVLKAGGAYIPLDPDYPLDRLRFMLVDGDPVALLTLECFKKLFLELALPVLDLGDAAAWHDQPETDPDPVEIGLTPQHLAYVIYTSGSAGPPKGVMIEHASLVNHTMWQSEAFDFTPDDVFLQRTSISFDASVWELWTPLSVGARLFLLPSPTEKSVTAIAKTIRHNGITVAQFVPSLLEVLSHDLSEDGSLLVRYIFCGGEALSPSLVRRALPLVSEDLVNLYGPTEATIDALWWKCTHSTVHASIPIGRPIANTRIYILDEHGEPVPVGVTGELYIGGAGVARGYLNRPELTAERFLKDPFAAELDARMYKTGDLGRWLADGTIEFLGRNDFQVKIRGYRIELGEIEARLAEHIGVREAVVIAREDTPGDKRLVAYYTVTETSKQNAAEFGAEHLRAHLCSTLPEYMIPAAYVRLKSMPLTPNGKLDREALPMPEADAYAVRSYEPPQGEIETTLAGIWADVLKLERVGRHDNFFELGGHSLKAAQIISRVRIAFAEELTLETLFSCLTIAELAPHIGGRKRVPVRDQSLLPLHLTATMDSQQVPVSFSQEGIWFIQQLAAENRAYHARNIIKLNGVLDVAALKNSLGELVKAHQILRTTFPAVDGEPFQLVHDDSPCPLNIINLEGVMERQHALQRWIGEKLTTSFDVTKLPLVRWTLFRLSPKEHVLIQLEHHLIHDGWSFNLLLSQMFQFYKSFAHKEQYRLSEYRLQFSQFCRWQRAWIGSEEAAAQMAYWRCKLDGTFTPIRLGPNKLNSQLRSFQGNSKRIELPLSLCRSLRRLCQEEKVTLFMFMLAVFKVLLFRYTGTQDVMVGTGIANRRNRLLEDVVGMMVNTVVLRTSLEGDPTLRELLSRVRTTCLEVAAHQEMPFEKVVENIAPQRHLNRNPFFDVMFSFHDSPITAVEIPELDVTVLEAVANGSAKFDLSIIVIPHSKERVSYGYKDPDGISIVWEYSTDILDDSSAERMLGHWKNLLESAAEDPALRISRLRMLSETERTQVLNEWNNTAVEFPRDKCVHELFEEQVRNNPEATAVVCDHASLNYAELNCRANQLARHIRQIAVMPHARVAVCLERSIELVVAELAILKSGGAYVPIDPSFPDERKCFIIRDCQTALVLSVGKINLPEISGITRVNLDQTLEPAPRVPVLDVPVDSEEPAYVMYTSGSAGHPKGVIVPHRAIIRLVLNNGFARFAASDHVAFAANPAFDATTMEVWGPLLNGGSVVVITEDVLLNPARFRESLKRHSINILWLTVGLFNQYVDELNEEIRALCYLIIGGDALDPRTVSRTLQSNPPQHLLNGYGPTETTTFATTQEITSVAQNAQSIPIGRPIANTRIYILDEHGEPVPVGVTGELYIGGAGVARGYLNRPELTAERFLKDPFAAELDARMYKTGDLGRWLADGTIEFLGRNDFQVKIRGYRIELGEIEARLAEHIGVREAVVIAREDTPGDKRLVAYYTVTETSKQNAAEFGAEHLRAHLCSTLPEYMIPAAYVRLKSMPLTPNGKLDREALPMPEADAYAVRSYEPPQGEIETTLAGIWADVLKLERVGRHDNFFELGGHSLKATKLINRIRSKLGVEISIPTLFDRPTVCEIATLCYEDRSDE